MGNKRLRYQRSRMFKDDLEKAFEITEFKSEFECQMFTYKLGIERYIKEHPEENLNDLLDGCETIEDYVNKYPLKQDEFNGNWRNDI